MADKVPAWASDQATVPAWASDAPQSVTPEAPKSGMAKFFGGVGEEIGRDFGAIKQWWKDSGELSARVGEIEKKPMSEWTPEERATWKQYAMGIGLGFAGGGIAAKPVGEAASAIGRTAGRVASDVAPGGTARAQSTVSEIGTSTTPSLRGDAIRTEMVNGLTAAGPGRAASFEASLRARGIDPYSRDAAQLAKSVFKTRDTVDVVKRLIGPDAMERSAGDFAASQLDAVTGTANRSLMPGRQAATMADRAERWVRQNEDWLQSTPETRQAANDYVSYLRRTAATQRTVGVLGFGAFLEETGGIPGWVKHLLF